MTWWHYALGGVCGGFAVEAVVGFALAWATGATGRITGSMGALAVGVAVPLVMEQMARQVPLCDEPQPWELQRGDPQVDERPRA